MNKVVPANKTAELLKDYWSPKVIGEVDDSYIKVAKLKGEFTWHNHEDEDELFYILKGELSIEMESSTVHLSEGDMYIVPKGVMHNPIAKEECHVLLMENKGTLHTGNVKSEKTRSIKEQLKE